MSSSTFSAKEPSLGYLYQIQYGLLLLLNSKQEDNVKLLIETLDDIELQIEDKTKLHQAKFHLKGNTNLTDRSPDFWKTIRVWAEQISNKTIDIDNTIFTLITTEHISTSSVVLDIKNKNNIDEILKKLIVIAKETEKNATNKQGYIAFKALSTFQQRTLINNIHIRDASLDFNDLTIQIKNELRFSVEPLKIDSCFERLTGWFLDKTILHLHEEKEFISFKELEQQLLLIIDSFKKDNLPMDFPDKISLTDEELKKVKSFNFLKQLQLINISSRMEKTAISDYYRAFQQKSKWLRENLLNPQEEIDYDKKLIDNWDRKFDLLVDDCETLSDDEKKIKGKKFYRKFYIDTIPRVFIRERFEETYLIVGSCHMLANRLKIGWNPDFEKLLKVEK
jgi:hypothetical protein